MSYLNYGAYIWKNGVDITNQFADKAFYFSNGWKEIKEYDEVTNQTIVDGHVVLIFENFAIEFYKTYNPSIVTTSGKRISLPEKYSFKKDYIYSYKDFTIQKFQMNDEGSIIDYEIKYHKDTYKVIIGSCFGKGWGDQLTSKFVKKYMFFDRNQERYFLNHKWALVAGEDEVINYLTRKDDINFKKSHLWTFGIKKLLEGIIKLDLEDIKWAIEEIKEYLIKIKLLK